jgi:hypothetical protein
MISIAASLIALLAVSGPSVANMATPCGTTSAGEPKFVCFCQPGASPGSPGCKCTKVAKDESGVDVY